MDTNRQIFRDSGSASGAELGRVFGGYSDYCPTSLLRFEGQYVKEPEPRRIIHSFIDGMIAIPSFHIFNTNGAVILDQLVGDLELKIPSLVGYLLTSFSNQDSCLFSAIRAFDSTAKTALFHYQYIVETIKEVGIADFSAIGESEKRLKPDINSHNLIRGGQCFERHFIAGEAGVPFIGWCPANGDGLDGTFNRAGQSQLEPADVPDREIFAIKFPALSFESETVIPIPTLETRKPCLVTILNPYPKCLIGVIKPFQYLLKDLSIHLFIFRESHFKLRELFNLVITRNRAVVRVVGIFALLKCSIIKLATQNKPTLNFLDSFRVGSDTVLECFSPLHNSSIAKLGMGVK